MKKELHRKVDESINIIRKAENLALSLNDEGIYVAFSGGKDSQVLLELVRMAGVKYKAYYSVTGVDAPENVYFIRNNYPEVMFVTHEQTFLRLVERYGLPMIQYRFCCRLLKENFGAGRLMVDGVRAGESRKRAKYSEVMVRSRRKENIERGRNRTIEEIGENQHRCIKGKDRIDVHPILRWSGSDVWDFIDERELPINKLYKSVGRVGCMFCPFASREQIEVYRRKYPIYYKRLLLSIQRFLEKKPLFDDPQEYFNWWISGMTIEKYKELFCLKF